VRSFPFWVAAAGGVLLAATGAVGSWELGVVGAILFVAGVAWFFAAALRRSRSDGVSVGVSLGRTAREALRFAWYLMP
jgi:hypothetical protein